LRPTNRRRGDYEISLHDGEKKMTPDFLLGLHQRHPSEVAEQLKTWNLDSDDLKAALADVYERIAALEHINRIL